MSTRSQARRRKGSTRMKAASQQQNRHEVIREWAHNEAVQNNGSVFAYWDTHVAEPLYVYFVRECDPAGPVKIGEAVDPHKRLETLQCGNPRPLVIEHLILASRGTERHLHTIWRDARMNGEWFGKGYEDAILAYAEQLSAMQICDHKIGQDRDWLTNGLLDAMLEREMAA